MSKIDLKRVRVVKSFGRSMMPLLLEGDVVHLQKRKFEKTTVDDIIAVKKKGKVFTHRVIYKTRKYLVTRGDNNIFDDGKIYSRNIIGIVDKVKRGEQIFDVNLPYLVQSSVYFSEMIAVSKELSKAKLDFVFLKGLPVYLYFLKRFPTRIYADCDILVSDFNKTSKVLKKMGFKREQLSKDDLKIKKNVEISFTKNINNFLVVIDVHLRATLIVLRAGNVNLLYDQALQKKLAEKFLQERVLVRVNGEVFPILSNENLFIYLCMHLFHHNFKEAYRYDFIVQLLRKKLNYGIIKNTVEDYKLENFIYPCLMLLRKYYNPNNIKKLEAVIKRPKRMVNLANINIFEPEFFGSGRSFYVAFVSSPSPVWKKTLIFFDKKVIVSLVRVVVKGFLFQINSKSKIKMRTNPYWVG